MVLVRATDIKQEATALHDIHEVIANIIILGPRVCRSRIKFSVAQRLRAVQKLINMRILRRAGSGAINDGALIWADTVDACFYCAYPEAV